MKKPRFESISELITRALGRPEVLRRMRAQTAMHYWKECVGAQLYEKSRPERYDGKTLWVAAASSAWVQELRMRRREILNRLNTIAAEQLFEDLRVGVRPLAVEALVNEQEMQRFEPVDIELRFQHSEIEAAAKEVLGRLKAASLRQKQLDAQ